jgi:predicted nucleic acid-binding Zn ribbon protein
MSAQARRLLDRARRMAPPKPKRRRRPAPEEQSWSGAAPDGRDPTPVGAAVGDLVAERKWDATLRAAGIEARWDTIVGAEVAGHCRPERLENGELTCVAESTAWATQIRLLSRQLIERLAADLGPGVVTRLRVLGPTAPNWRHGPLRVTGRGPRDTYG